MCVRGCLPSTRRVGWRRRFGNDGQAVDDLSITDTTNVRTDHHPEGLADTEQLLDHDLGERVGHRGAVGDAEAVLGVGSVDDELHGQRDDQRIQLDDRHQQTVDEPDQRLPRRGRSALRRRRRSFAPLETPTNMLASSEIDAAIDRSMPPTMITNI